MAEGRRQAIYDRLMAMSEEREGPLDTPCRIFTGADSGDGRGGGYGRWSLEGRTVAPHRVMATHTHGYIPPTRQVDHRCNDRRCIAEDHLEIVSHKENQRRRDRRLSKKAESATKDATRPEGDANV